MTFEEFVKSNLESCGMFPNQCNIVFEIVKNAKENQSMADRWTDDISFYPEIMQNSILLSAKTQALIWVDENCPQAWFRPVLAS